MKERKCVLNFIGKAFQKPVDLDKLQDSFEVLTLENVSELKKIVTEEQETLDVVLWLCKDEIADCLQMLEMMKKSSKYGKVPVIVFAEKYDVSVERNVLKMDTCEYLASPWDLESIVLRLENAIKRKKMYALSDYDTLTGIYNKKKFMEMTKDMLKKYPKERMVFIRMDIERFQFINAFYGTEVGDDVLRFVGKSLEKYIKNCEIATYGRIEADVFALCLAYKDMQNVVKSVGDIREVFNQFPLEFDIVPAFGIYVIEDKKLPIEIMIDRAKLAAKTIKGQFMKNYAFYTADMGNVLKEEQQIMNEMVHALENEEFVVYLQPKYNIKSKLPVGAEALVRWVHPEKGMISPGIFVPIFEKNGFVTKLDYYVWKQVCILLRKWLDEGKTPNPISVNMSRVNFFNQNIVQVFCDLVDSYQIPRDLIQVEVTESVYADNNVTVREKVKRLREEGFLVLMDDFGSGYSSLNVLKDVEVDVLKIDMRFFEATDINGRGENIIASVVRMAKWLDIKVIAEGVEKEEQVEFLRNIGCELVQGFYFAKPMPAYAYESIACISSGFQKYNKNQFDANQIFAMDAEMEHLISDSTQAIAVYEYDQETLEIIRVNNAYYELMGYDDRYIHTNNVLDILEEKSKKVLQATLEDVIKTKGTLSCEYEKVASNGKRIWLHLKLKHISHMDGRDIIIGTHIDFTGEKRVEDSFNKYVNALQSATMFDESKEEGILIVDDMEFNRGILRDMMKEQYRIFEACNGREALEILEEHYMDIRLILLDITMPEMDGKEFLAIKNKNLMYRDIAVVVISAEEDEKVQLNMLESGVNDYITKPFMKEMVLRRIKNVIEYNNRFRNMMYEYSKIAKKLSTKNSMYDTILVVEDLALNRAMIRDMFKNDFTVLEASNGKEALTIIEQYNYRIDVILLDLFMPVMSGIEFLAEKKKNELMSDIPVVVITADDTVAQQVNVLDLGASDYVVRPIVEEVLTRRVHNVMESNYQYKKMLKQYYNVVEQTTADPLTHLYSKSTAEEMIMRIIKENPDKCHALIVMDVDDFTDINDKYGHNYGDVVLINVADKLKSYFRTDDVLARINGVQFCLFMQDVPSAKIAEKKCNELLQEIAKMRIGKKQLAITCSMGIAIAENKPMKFQELYERAENALNAGKKEGKGQATLSTKIY